MESDWLGSVDGMTSLRSYRMIKEELMPEGYLRLLDSGDVRLRSRLRSGSAGLLEDKKRCRMCVDDRCVLCDSGVVEDLVHFLSVAM